jgi:hypothetical protein
MGENPTPVFDLYAIISDRKDSRVIRRLKIRCSES